MKKRHILIFGALILGLAGCGKSGSNGKKATATDASVTDAEKIKQDKLTFSQKGGVYDKEFDLTIEAKEGYTIYYTVDGSNPLNSKTAMEYTGPIHIKDMRGTANVVSAVDPDLFCSNFSDYRKGVVDCYIEAPSDDAVDKGMTVRAIGINKDIYVPVVEENTEATTEAASEQATEEASDFDMENATDDSDTYIVPGLTKSASNTYFIGTMEEHINGITESVASTGTDLAVMSITMNYDDLFDYETGIYVRGKKFDEALEKEIASNNRFDAEASRKIAANYNQRGREWEREAHVEFYEANSEGMVQQFSQDCGIRIQGNYSRSDLQKGFRLYARKSYGKKNFKYNMFGDKATDETGAPIDKFGSLVLRAGGNCAFTSKYNDTYWQKVAAEVACSTKASRACVVYLNGEYWGLYVLEEDYSDDYFEDHYGVNKDDVVLYKGDAETYSRGYKLDLGEPPADQINNVNYYFDDLKRFLRTHKDLKNQADYDELAKIVDVDSIMDYFAVESWINNKWDWPGKNWSMWKTKNVDPNNPYADGKWRFCLYDIEFGGVSGEGDAYVNTIKEDNYKPMGLLDQDTTNPAVKCFALLMTNESFNDKFCARLQEFSNTYFEKETALSILTGLEKEYGPLFDQFYDRYPKTGSKNDALNGGYASSKCIRDFLGKRADNIDKMVEYCQKHIGK